MWETPAYVWKRNEAHCEQVLLSGGQAEVTESCFGANDFVIGALMELGFWDTMTRMYPNRLKEENGYHWQVLNGVEILRCLLGEHKIHGVNKVLSDGRLVATAGFNLQEAKVSRKLAEGKPVMDSETLSNHLERIDAESSYYTFFEFVKHMRQHRWLGGKVYAADAKEITVPYGRGYDGMGKKGDAHGYHLETLLNVQEGRELFAGFCFGPLQRSEKPMLLEIFDRYQERVGPVKELIEILLLDRLYWGAGFFRTLTEQYHVDFVTRARDRDLELVKNIFQLIEADKGLPAARKTFKWKWRTEKRPPSKKYPRGEVRKLRMAGLDGLQIYDEQGKPVTVNVVVVYEYDQDRKPIMDPEDPTRQLVSIYVTSLSAEADPLRIRKLYRQRWVIENQGFRTANQRWGLDRLASRVSADAMQAHIAFCLMLHNSQKIVQKKFPGPWQEEMERLKNLGRDELAGGFGIIVYTPDGYVGIFGARRFRKIVHTAGHTAGQTAATVRLKDKLRSALQAGHDPQAILDLLDTL